MGRKMNIKKLKRKLKKLARKNDRNEWRILSFCEKNLELREENEILKNEIAKLKKKSIFSRIWRWLRCIK